MFWPKPRLKPRVLHNCDIAPKNCVFSSVRHPSKHLKTVLNIQVSRFQFLTPVTWSKSKLFTGSSKIICPPPLLRNNLRNRRPAASLITVLPNLDWNGIQPGDKHRHSNTRRLSVEVQPYDILTPSQQRQWRTQVRLYLYYNVDKFLANDVTQDDLVSHWNS